MRLDIASTNTTPVEESVNRNEPSKKEKFYYGLGSIGWVTMPPIIGSFLTFYYTNVVGLSAAFVGTLMLIGRLFDGISDVGIGILIDRTRSKHGQARPWLLWASFPMSLSFALMFSIPELGAVGQEVYATISYIVFTLLFTAIIIPYNTLLGLMSQDTNHRTTTNAIRGIFSITGTLVVMVLTTPVVNALGGGKSGWIIIAWGLAFITLLTILVGFRKVKERVTVDKMREVVPRKKLFKSLLTNKYWVLITLFNTVNKMLTAIIMGGSTYYVVMVFGSSSYFSLFAAATLTPSVLALFFITPAAKKFGKRNVALLASIIACTGPAIKLVDPSNIIVVFIANFIQGFCLISVFTLIEAMINDTVEYGEWKSGFRTAGLVNSCTGYGEKIGTGLGAAVVGWSLAAAGYVGVDAHQSYDVRRIIIYDLNIYVPLVLCIFQAALLYFYKLDTVFPTIIKELQNRNIAKS